MSLFGIGCDPNKRRQKTVEITDLDNNCRLSIIEYDDQGRSYGSGPTATSPQLSPIVDYLKDLEAKNQDAIILVFVHGWKHNALAEDGNMVKFTGVLRDLAANRRDQSIPIFGIYVAWRGRSLHGHGTENLTFYSRKKAGLRVAMGAPRELFAYLRQYRHHRLKVQGSPILAIFGHSFGGMIAFAALGQSLIEAAATQSGRIVPAFADLVMLINPAVEATRYLPIHDLMNRASAEKFDAAQPPAFVCVTAHNDSATGFWFRVGTWLTTRFDKTIGPDERIALVNSIGHIDFLRTHELTAKPAPGSDPCGKVWLRALKPSCPRPFWVVGASKDVIDNHNGFWTDGFESFIREIVLRHIHGDKERKRDAITLSDFKFVDGTTDAAAIGAIASQAIANVGRPWTGSAPTAS